MSRNFKRVLATITVIGMLGIGVLRPSQTRAMDTEEGLLIAGAALVGYVAIVIIGTRLAFPRELASTDGMPIGWGGQQLEASGFRLADRCPQTTTGITFACW